MRFTASHPKTVLFFSSSMLARRSAPSAATVAAVARRSQAAVVVPRALMAGYKAPTTESGQFRSPGPRGVRLGGRTIEDRGPYLLRSESPGTAGSSAVEPMDLKNSIPPIEVSGSFSFSSLRVLVPLLPRSSFPCGFGISLFCGSQRLPFSVVFFAPDLIDLQFPPFLWLSFSLRFVSSLLAKLLTRCTSFGTDCWFLNSFARVALPPGAPPTERVVRCDGGDVSGGHPAVFLNLESPEPTECQYCGARYVRKAHHH
jgi:uncharacterized Zn-finger protein